MSKSSGELKTDIDNNEQCHVITLFETIQLPGPLEPPLNSLPSRNMTALSYSCTTYKNQRYQITYCMDSIQSCFYWKHYGNVCIDNEG